MARCGRNHASSTNRTSILPLPSVAVQSWLRFFRVIVEECDSVVGCPDEEEDNLVAVVGSDFNVILRWRSVCRDPRLTMLSWLDSLASRCSARGEFSIHGAYIRMTECCP